MKANPWRLIRAHYATLVDNRNGRPRVRDYLAFVGIPAAVFAAGWAEGVDLSKTASVGLLTVAGLMAAFFFGALLQVAMRAVSWADERPDPSRAVTRHADFLGQLAANAGYSALVAVSTAGSSLLTTVTGGTAHTILSALSVGLAVHLVLMLLMVIVRIFGLTQERLRHVHTGKAQVTALASKKKAGNG